MSQTRRDEVMRQIAQAKEAQDPALRRAAARLEKKLLPPAKRHRRMPAA
jgi:flagellar motor switch protein FliG